MGKGKNLGPMILFGLQVVAHLMFVWLLFAEPSYLLISLVVYFITGCFGMTMTYHRGLSHRSWKMPKWFEYVGTCIATYGLTGSSIAWVSQHRRHHAATDTLDDPHSPNYSNVLLVQFASMFDDVQLTFAKDLVKDAFHRYMHEHYFLVHLAIIVFWLAVGGPLMLAACYFAPAAILWNMGSLVNTLNHMRGYRNHSTKDASTNHVLTGFLVWGEGWHNNHHFNKSNPNFGEKWWEIDIGYFFIKRIQK